MSPLSTRAPSVTDRAGLTWAVAEAADISALLRREHYLGPLKGGRLIMAARDQSGDPVAALVWRSPTSRRMPSDGTFLELSRWCLTPAAGVNAGSRSHGAAVRLIRQLFPGVTTLLSYSDPSAGHRGELYRACNYLWAPTWHRLRPPPTGLGSWDGVTRQAVKDRWVYPVRRDERLADIVAIRDAGAIRRWTEGPPTDLELRLALRAPASDLAAAARVLQEDRNAFLRSSDNPTGAPA